MPESAGRSEGQPGAADPVAAAALHAAVCSNMHNLWTVYVVATFAAAGFGATKDDLNPGVALAVTIGFLVFAYGHWHLLRGTLKTLEALRVDISAGKGPEADKGGDGTTAQPLSGVLAAIGDTEYRVNPAWAHHVLIDACVIIAIWAPIVVAWPGKE